MFDLNIITLLCNISAEFSYIYVINYKWLIHQSP
jgi:hypothetical protein